jgi:hypothetical protein
MKSTNGPLVFVLPDGRKSKLSRIEIDAGWKKAGPNWDIAVCTLAEDLGKDGHAAWGILDNKFIGAMMHLTGYDVDYAAIDPQTGIWKPRLVDRQSAIQASNQMELKKTTAYISMTTRFLVAGIKDNSYSRENGLNFATAGAFAVAAGYQTLMNQQYDAGGWQAGMKADVGSNGGPIWMLMDGVPTVCGVVSAFTVLKPTAVGTDFLFNPSITSAVAPKPTSASGTAGARIAEGICYRMIRDHIGAH